MEANIMKSESCFSLHLDGNNSIDAMVLSELINDIAQLTKVAANLQDPESYLRMDVTAFENGSFQIDFSAIRELAENLINCPTQLLTFASQAINTVKGFFEIKKLLKGNKEKSITDNGNGSVTVTSQNSGIVIVNKNSTLILENSHIDNLVVNIAKNVQNHNTHGGFSLDTDEGNYYYSANDVIEMNKPLPIVTEELIKRSTVKADLLIGKPDLVKNTAWIFHYNGKMIKAKIFDMDFLDEMHKGKMAIHSGDYITADLEISVPLENGLPLDNATKYAIVKVYDGIKNDFDNQMNLLEK